MIGANYLMIILIFVIYYLIVLIKERKLMRDPKDIIGKFLAIILLYAGFSIIYYSLTGKPFLNETIDNYNLYIFVIGFIAVLWSIPVLLQEFEFFRRFLAKKNPSKPEKINVKKEIGKISN